MNQEHSPRPWWLAQRLAWHLAAVMIVAVTLAAFAVVWRTLATIRSLDDAALQSQGELVAASITIAPDGAPRLPSSIYRAFKASDDGSMFFVYDATGALVLASEPQAIDTVTPFLPRPPRTGIFRVLPSVAYPQGLVGAVTVSAPWRVVSAQARDHNDALRESLLRTFLFSAVWLLVPIGTVTVAIGVLTIRSGLRPVREASAAAARVEPGRPGVRLPSAGLPGEVVPMVGAVNAALARLEQALDAQRRFVAEAAHALRTPLAVLTARIDELPDGAAAGPLRGDVDRMTRLVEQMLAMARLEELPLNLSGSVDLHRAAVEAISDLAPLAISRRVELALTEHTTLARVPGNAASIVLALTNLLDNALAYAPKGSTVEVELAPPATLRVLDRGPGVAEAQREKIFARFRRGSGARAGGAGLGLAIVAEIAAAHGGSARYEPRPGGGSVFVLELGTTRRT